MASWQDDAIEVEDDWQLTATPVYSRTIQEMHPSITFKDRAIIKNFSQSPEKSLEYLRSQHPELDFKVDEGEVLVRSQGEQDYRVVDPNTGFFSKDMLADAGDMAFDVGAGALEGVAGTLGAVGGAIATPFAAGAGAIPGAMAAGGAVSAGNEAIRQKIGQALGIPQNVDGTDVAISGALGAAAPMLFGAGKARGALKTAWDGTKSNVLPRLGSMMSGVKSETLKNYSDDGIRASVEGLEQAGVDDYVGKAYDKIKNYVESNRDRAGQELTEAIDATGKPVNITGAKEGFRAKASPDGFTTTTDAGKIDQLRDAYKKVFGLQTVDNPAQLFDWNTMTTKSAATELPDKVSAQRAWQLQKDMRQMAKWEQSMTPETAHMKNAARGGYGSINNALDDASEGLTSQAKNQYTAAKQLEDELLPKFEGKTRMDSIQKAYNQLSSMDVKSRQLLKERLSKLADSGQLDLTNESKVLSTFAELGNPKLMPISSGGTTSTSRSIPAAGIGGLVGAYAGNQAGFSGQPGLDSGIGAAAGIGLGTLLGSPAAMKKIIRANARTSSFKKKISPKSDNLRRGLRSGAWTELLKETQED